MVSIGEWNFLKLKDDFTGCNVFSHREYGIRKHPLRRAVLMPLAMSSLWRAGFSGWVQRGTLTPCQGNPTFFNHRSTIPHTIKKKKLLWLFLKFRYESDGVMVVISSCNIIFMFHPIFLSSDVRFSKLRFQIKDQKRMCNGNTLELRF